jgi:hypothetical protein
LGFDPTLNKSNKFYGPSPSTPQLILAHSLCRGAATEEVATRAANGLGLNGFNELGFQVGVLWMGENWLIYLAGRVGFGLIENWVRWVRIGFFFLCEWVEPWVDVKLLIYHTIHIY